MKWTSAPSTAVRKWSKALSCASAARQSYESAYREVQIGINGGGNANGKGTPFVLPVQDFDPGAGVDTLQKVHVTTDGNGQAFIIFSLQWDQPFFSVSGGSGSLNDYDFVLMDDPPTTVLKSSINGNVGGDPVEVMQYAHALTTTTFNLVILEHDPGQTEPDAGLLKWIAFNRVTPIEFATNSGTCYGQANAQGAEAVGAAFYGDTPPFGLTIRCS